LRKNAGLLVQWSGGGTGAAEERVSLAGLKEFRRSIRARREIFGRERGAFLQSRGREAKSGNQTMEGKWRLKRVTGVFEEGG